MDGCKDGWVMEKEGRKGGREDKSNILFWGEKSLRSKGRNLQLRKFSFR